MMTEEELELLNAYRCAVINLCAQNGGSLAVAVPESGTPAGSVLWRWTPEGLEFEWRKDEGQPH